VQTALYLTGHIEEMPAAYLSFILATLVGRRYLDEAWVGRQPVDRIRFGGVGIFVSTIVLIIVSAATRVWSGFVWRRKENGVRNGPSLCC